MTQKTPSLANIYEGWAGHQTSLVNAIVPLTPEQLLWRPAVNLNSVSELAWHISLGRITWFAHMDAPGSAVLVDQIQTWQEDSDGHRDIVESALSITEQPEQLVRWLETTWQVIELTLKRWDVADLAQTYPHTWNEQAYAVSRQWTLWRILNHDIHHGGQIALILGMQGIEAFELSTLFGHITLSPLAEPL